MITGIVEGIYGQGKIELLEKPAGLPQGPVRVIIIAAEQPKPPPCYLTFGKYQTGRMSALEDFKDAEGPGEEKFNHNRG